MVRATVGPGDAPGSSDGPGDGGEAGGGRGGRIAGCTPEEFTLYGAGVVQRRLINRYLESAAAKPDQVAPRGAAEWAQFFEASGVRVMPVRAGDDFGGLIVRHHRHGWVVFVNRCLREQKLCMVYCHEFCEFLMADCPMLGECAPEHLTEAKADLRDRIANQVTAELS